MVQALWRFPEEATFGAKPAVKLSDWLECPWRESSVRL